MAIAVAVAANADNTMRVVGFEFVERPSSDASPGQVMSFGSKRLTCPVSPLGTLLQKHDSDSLMGGASSDDASRASDSNYTDSDGGYGYNDDGDYYSYGSHGHSWEANGYEVNPCMPAATVMRTPPTFKAVQRSFSTPCKLEVCETTSSTFATPIPIPEAKAKTPAPKEKPKLVKRVPEPPMLRAITAPAVVEQVYAEYERAKQQLEEERLYHKMLAQQGDATKPRRRKTDSARPEGMDLGTEMDKLSWRTVYTQLQSDKLPMRQLSLTSGVRY